MKQKPLPLVTWSAGDSPALIPWTEIIIILLSSPPLGEAGGGFSLSFCMCMQNQMLNAYRNLDNGLVAFLALWLSLSCNLGIAKEG